MKVLLLLTYYYYYFIIIIIITHKKTYGTWHLVTRITRTCNKTKELAYRHVQ